MLGRSMFNSTGPSWRAPSPSARTVFTHQEDRPIRILAVYGSDYGQAEAVLRRVAGVLESRGHAVTVFKGDAVPAGLALADFDAVVIAASVIMGRYQAYIREFVRRHAAALWARPGAFISVNGASPESNAEWRAAARQYVDEFLKNAAWEPRWTATFSGALRYRSYGFVTRWIMKMISRWTGGPTDTTQDYEFTDWNAGRTVCQRSGRGARSCSFLSLAESRLAMLERSSPHDRRSVPA